MITSHSRKDDHFVFAISPDRSDFEGDGNSCGALTRGAYDVVVTDEEVRAYREDMSEDGLSPLLAAIQRQDSDLKVAASVAIEKLAAHNEYLAGRTEIPTEGVYLMETDAEAQTKFRVKLAEGQKKAFDAIREQQLGERWYERIKEVSGIKTSRVLPAREGPNGLKYD